ncbi:patellin-2-like [Phragmites australis]|uniref:patellin-2-like n=1 Tax=Phragmites australis TaxID=29695 RepID=UPI002D766C5F|nr:patellin-2-like [Phragmites australis]
MGCGGSKDDVATGNTTASAGGKLLRRKSSVPTSHTSSSSSSGKTGVVVKDVVKETAAGEAKEDVVEVTSTEKSIAASVVEEKTEEVVVVKKDVADDVADAAPAIEFTVTEAVAAPAPEAEQVKKAEEQQLPESFMADVEPPKVDEAKEVVLNDEEERKVEKVEESKNVEEKVMSPAVPLRQMRTYVESVGQQNSTTEPVEAKPVDQHKVEEVAVSESSEKKNNADAEQTTAAPSEPPAN